MLILKIGGGREINLSGIAGDLAALTGPVIVVHGANAWRDQLASALGREKTVVTSSAGYSSVLSDEPAVELLMMAYAGLQNKRLVAAFQQKGINAVGLSGLDGRVIQARRNSGIRIKDGDKIRVLRDLSGKPDAVNTGLLNLLLENGYTPVLTMPLIDENAVAVNSENDDVVVLLHQTYLASVILQLIEAPGFLRDPEDPASLIASLHPAGIAEWEARAKGRIKRKLHALGKLFTHGSPTVIIADGRREHPVRDALAGGGTVIADRQPPAGDTP
jgi:acetylglutamate/LysW-gamma-L-alpha-aminoadipate kinase